MKYIAVDIGSSFIKSAVLDTDCFVITDIMKHTTPQKLKDNDNGFFEVDPNLIFSIVSDMIDKQWEKYDTLEGVLISTQMHGFILSDVTGKPVTPYISWQDTRGLLPYKYTSSSYMDHLSELISSEDIKKTGIRLKPGLASCNLYHWVQNNQDIIKSEKELKFCTLGSYIIFRLAGRNVCHMTNAAPTGFADIEKGCWNPNIIKAVGCESLSFPEIQEEDKICGYYNTHMGKLKVYPDIGDHQATVLGAMSEPEKNVAITIGTAGLAGVVTKDSTHGEFEIRPFFDSYVLKTITRLPGGRNLDVLVKFIEEIGETVYNKTIDKNTIWEIIHQSINREWTDYPVVEMGFFRGQTGVSRGRIDGINDFNFKLGSIFKGAFFNMAQVYTWAIHTLCGPANEIENLIVSGGVFHGNSFFSETLEKVSGKKVITSGVSEEALMGLLKLAKKIECKI